MLLASGVGNNPQSGAKVRGADVGRSYAIPFRIVPEKGQVSENNSKPSTSERCDVLHDDDFGSKLANESGILPPQARSFTLDASARAGKADVLAGEPAADGANPNSVCGQSFSREGADVVINLHPREMMG